MLNAQSSHLWIGTIWNRQKSVNKFHSSKAYACTKQIWTIDYQLFLVLYSNTETCWVLLMEKRNKILPSSLKLTFLQERMVGKFENIAFVFRPCGSFCSFSYCLKNFWIPRKLHRTSSIEFLILSAAYDIVQMRTKKSHALFRKYFACLLHFM